MEPIHVLEIQKTCDAGFIQDVEAASGQRVRNCYQCGNCSASCGYTRFYDYPVSQIMRLVQLGQRDIVLGCRSVWLCAACQGCTTRCPCNIDVAAVMEALRVMSRRDGKVSEGDVRMFYDEFLRSVKTFGRVFETGLLPVYGLLSRKPLTDMDLAPGVLRKGKLTFLPHRIARRREVTGIFERFEELRRKGASEGGRADDH
ncbi:MAG: 4Fe-4S dicluster domain-containing protein [Syntrophobacteraceae bacterium]|jgi:heterodisulfide reductase subunit C|nr:4Fe-4S dicluster domain-containing protein [Syntrophobacteraceae bacterium]